MNIQDFFREHQMIRMTTILSIIIVGFISAIFGLSMLMQVVNGITIHTDIGDCVFAIPSKDSIKECEELIKRDNATIEKYNDTKYTNSSLDNQTVNENTTDNMCRASDPSSKACNGQNTSSSMVDKLIEDTKRDNADNAKEQAYRAELINRIKNSTCTKDLDKLPDLSEDDMQNKNIFENFEDYPDFSGLTGKTPDKDKLESFILSNLNVTNLENYFKLCVREGKIN